MSVKDILKAMTTADGRSAKKDLFGQPGGYREVLSAEPKGKPRLRCDRENVKEAFPDGNIYTRPDCQRA